MRVHRRCGLARVSRLARHPQSCSSSAVAHSRRRSRAEYRRIHQNAKLGSPATLARQSGISCSSCWSAQSCGRSPTEHRCITSGVNANRRPLCRTAPDPFERGWHSKSADMLGHKRSPAKHRYAAGESSTRWIPARASSWLGLGRSVCVLDSIQSASPQPASKRVPAAKTQGQEKN